jgi:hypothetical protein
MKDLLHRATTLSIISAEMLQWPEACLFVHSAYFTNWKEKEDQMVMGNYVKLDSNLE